MSNPDLSSILEDLAAGRIDAAEAARRIDSAPKADEPRPSEPTNEELSAAAEGAEHAFGEPRQFSPYAREVFSEAEEPPAAPRTGANGVDRIVVRAVGRRVRILGDRAVATVAAEGPHLLRRAGSILEVSSDGDLGPQFDGFSLLRPPRSLDDIRSLGLGKELYLRVNPGITVDVEVTAGALTCQGLRRLGKIRLTAGSADIADVVEMEDVLVQAGSTTIRTGLLTGRSRVRVESGQLTVELPSEGNLSVRAEAQLGRITWPDGQQGLEEFVLGNGAARLDIGVVMGWATIKVDPR